MPAAMRFLGCLPAQIPREALAGVQTLVHCAAYAGDSERVAHAVNVEGTMRLAQLAKESGVGTFIYFSSSSARRDASSTYGRSKYAAECQLSGLEGLNIVIVRPNLVIGPGGRGVFGRMHQTVKNLPFLPLLGGGRSIVQPIHVDDLCEAVFRCINQAKDLHHTVLNLGHPQGVTLAEFLQTVSMASVGRRKTALPVPLWPVKILVRAAEALHIALPISSANLKGLERIERVETAPDLAKLELNLRPLKRLDLEESGPRLPDGTWSLQERAVRVLLIGAGRMGLVHAIALSRLKGIVLDGIVDINPSATTFLSRIGIAAPSYRSLEEALKQRQPDAAVIATPPASHLPLTRSCLQRGLAVMVEKPMAVYDAQLHVYERLGREYPTLPVQVGWVMPRCPQINSCIKKLRAGEYGNVQSFVGVSLLSSIHRRSANRWEVKKSLSGGGAYIAAGGHVLSMIHAAFGNPEAVEAQSRKLYSREVEDSLVATFRYPGFQGIHYCSWSIHGYPRLSSSLTITTDAGVLTLTPSVGIFIRHGDETELVHQLDTESGFNMAPDYAGAGFAHEYADLQAAVRFRSSPPMNLQEAVALERLLFRVYESAREVVNFESLSPTNETATAVPLALASRPSYTAGGIKTIQRILDLRDCPTETATVFLQAGNSNLPWDGYLILPRSVTTLRNLKIPDENVRVTIPDFYGQARLLFTNRYGELLRQMGVGGVVRAALGMASHLARDKAMTFWVAAAGLLKAALHAIPRRFRGTLLLHSYLADLALGVRQLDQLDGQLRLLRKACPNARVGFHTGMPGEAVNALHLLETPVDDLSVITSPDAKEAITCFPLAFQANSSSRFRLTAEVGMAPSVVHRLAAADPRHWALGAEAVVIGGMAEPSLAELRMVDARLNWRKAFPGLQLPRNME